jgi:hypothetical protein
MTLETMVMNRTHRCAAVDCTKLVPLRMLMCREHWMALPRGLRNQVWRTYQPGQEANLALADASYLSAVHEAQAWLAKHYGGPR